VGIRERPGGRLRRRVKNGADAKWIEGALSIQNKKGEYLILYPVYATGTGPGEQAKIVEFRGIAGNRWVKLVRVSPVPPASKRSFPWRDTS
jgi:hypothetical protein